MDFVDSKCTNSLISYMSLFLYLNIFDKDHCDNINN